MDRPPPSIRLACRFVSALLVVVAARAADTPSTPDHVARPASSAITIDGMLDEPAWRDATAIELAYEYFPGENVAPPVRTEARIAFDARHVYVAFRCFDPDPASIRAHLMDRDDVDAFIRDDHVVLIVDTFDDRRRGFQFRVNPMGVQMDALFSENEGVEDFSWDMIWDSAATIDDRGWSVEIALPVQQLRFPEGGGGIWGVDLARSYPRSERHRIAAHPRDRDDACALCQVVRVGGFEGLEPGRNLEIVPTLTATRVDVRDPFPGGDLVDGDPDAELGLTARWGPTPAVALSAAINPDFSQVEADAAQLAINERFALLFPEQRPFFLEGVDLFSTPIRAVFTRTVVDPDLGVKVTGKNGRNAYGVFLTDDRTNTVLLPTSEGTGVASSVDGALPGDARGGVGRYRRDVGRNHSVGVLVTTREAGDYDNRVAGVDGFVRLSSADSVSFQWLRSATRYPDTTAAALGQPTGRFEDEALVASWFHGGRRWIADATVRDYGRDFRADAGFLPRTDIREAAGSVKRRWWSDGRPGFTFVDVWVAFDRVEDQAGRRTDVVDEAGVQYAGPWQTTGYVRAFREEKRFGGRDYDDLGGVDVYLTSQPTGRIRIELFGGDRDTVDFANNQPASQRETSGTVDLRLGRRVSLDLDHTVRVADVDGGRLFRADLTELRAFWHWNVRSFVRAIVQREAIDRDPSLWSFPVEASSERWLGQLLWSWKLDPRTVAFVGYTESRIAGDGFGRTVADRAFFVKLGYAWLP